MKKIILFGIAITTFIITILANAEFSCPKQLHKYLNNVAKIEKKSCGFDVSSWDCWGTIDQEIADLKTFGGAYPKQDLINCIEKHYGTGVAHEVIIPFLYNCVQHIIKRNIDHNATKKLIMECDKFDLEIFKKIHQLPLKTGEYLEEEIV